MTHKFLKILFASALIVNCQLATVNSLKAQTDVALDPEVGGRLPFSLDTFL